MDKYVISEKICNFAFCMGIVFVDTEIGVGDHRLHDIGAVKDDGSVFHASSLAQLASFVRDCRYVCGHNVAHHDATYLAEALPQGAKLVDTLYLSPLLFPKRPYHRLLKDDKLQSDELNNPVNDSRKAQELFYDEVNAFNSLPEAMKQIFGKLLAEGEEYAGFFSYVGFMPDGADLVWQIADTFSNQVCAHADMGLMVRHYPRELAYVLANIAVDDGLSILPSWLLHTFPKVENVMKYLRHTPCAEGCPYCLQRLDIHGGLKRHFGYDAFRQYGGEPLQERAVRAAVAGKSLLAIFPTGGGKSLTFQLPALMEGETVHGLTVVISPLQSLMKDQVDNLAERGIASAVTINGLLDPVTRADAVARVADGTATLLYISPEMLRSKTIEHLLESRQVVRFVIDEAHCFSAWGQDFRVDYLYIGEFIAKLQERKSFRQPIPVSCFTATAKQKVVSDICDYFRRTLGVELEVFASSASRENLHYSVIHVDNDDDKYSRLRSLLGESGCPSIVYVSRTRRTVELAEKLNHDGISALPFNGKMEPNEKIANQNAFMSGEVRTIVATSAFGMGVDKKDVGLVVHYDISDSLENYVQEAGRAGRDPQMQAKCYVLYGDSDLDKHFVLLNQTKLSISEIQQVWTAIKGLTKLRTHTCCSALEIARQAGWDDSTNDVETRVRTAVAALEQSGYVKRGNNVPHVYATGINVKNMDEAHQRLSQSTLFAESERQDAIRIIKSLISSRSVARGQGEDAESRVDYLADRLGIAKEVVVSTVERMRQEGILADSRDMTAHLAEDDTQKHSRQILERYVRLEQFVLDSMGDDDMLRTTLRQLNDKAVGSGIPNATVRNLRTLLYFLTIKDYISKVEDPAVGGLAMRLKMSRKTTLHKFQKRTELSRFVIEKLYDIAATRPAGTPVTAPLQFSEVEMLRMYQAEQQKGLFSATEAASLYDIEEALLYLTKIGALRLEGGFLVLYNAMEIDRVKDSRMRYKQEDYRLLNEFYKQKIQQVHIVGEYANLMVSDYAAALQYVQDYFQMDYKKFIAKYFKGERAAEINKNITPAKYQQIFGQLSSRQRQIIDDSSSRCIVVAAGPGSGKTRVLVHKMASLLLLEEVKHEQLLMLTFSRAAATEFKQRLLDLIGNAAHFVEIKTFHSYCFDLLGRIGNLEDAKDVVQRAAAMIANGEVEPSRISKAVLVVDEAQDMDEHEYALVRALMSHNEEMRVIAVGDDDQGVYQFRGADAKYMRLLVDETGARLYEMNDNYRSAAAIVAVANQFATRLHDRMKTAPIVAVRQDEGVVEVVQHVGDHMEQPLVDQIASGERQGSCCVLTNTNDEALRIAALLRRHSVRCRLIQSMDGFRFGDLAEVRYFLRQIERGLTSPVVNDDLWELSKEAVLRTYEGSDTLEAMRRFFATFERVSRTKYFSDLTEFVLESSIEDFCPDGGNELFVSTIHKAKGREFDTVYMYVTDNRAVNEDYLRQLYVGITRAKRQLFVHCNNSLFNRLGIADYRYDPVCYGIPDTITVRLTHRDVFLDYFKDKKSLLLALRSGDKLCFSDGVLRNPEGMPLAKLSYKQEQELNHWRQQGYEVVEARVRYVVAWHPKDLPADQPDVAVLLADLHLRRKTS